MVRLPKDCRPRGVRYRSFTPGLDLPSWFHDDLKAIDSNLYIVFHPYRVMWDDIINEYEGSIEDPRFTIHQEHGELNFGFVLTNGQGVPTPDNTWHIWRLCRPHGWAHIVDIQDTHETYLKLLTRRLHLQARFSDRYGHRAWNHHVEGEKEAERVAALEAQQELFDAVHDENRWLLDKAAENFERGHTAPTNPQREQIISYPNQSHRSRVSRPLDDTEGGLVIPE